jgi:hypothetical protein
MVSVIYEYQKKYIKAWTIKHKDEIEKKNKEIIKCEVCNKELARHSLRSHNKTKKHLKKIANTLLQTSN